MHAAESLKQLALGYHNDLQVKDNFYMGLLLEEAAALNGFCLGLWLVLVSLEMNAIPPSKFIVLFSRSFFSPWKNYFGCSSLVRSNPVKLFVCQTVYRAFSYANNLL